MKKQCVTLCGCVLATMLIVGCASRTKIVAGPVQVAGEVQVFDTPQTASFDLSWNKVGFTVGRFGCEIESFVGPCEKVIGIESSTGNPVKVFADVPDLGSDSQ